MYCNNAYDEQLLCIWFLRLQDNMDMSLFTWCAAILHESAMFRPS